MLLGLMGAVSAVAAAVISICCGSFDGFGWLLVFVGSFVGMYLLLLLLAVGFLVLICRLVDLEKPQEHDSKFYRAVMYVYIEAIISLVLATIRTEGLEKTPKEGRFLLVCNHQHEADPGVLLHCFRKSQLAFISKQENDSMFVVNKMMHKTMCQLINRENDREALKTIIKCIQLLKDDEVSICAFPEGGIKELGKLSHFRSGMFKIAQKANVPIVVCTLRNTAQIIPNILKLKPTEVVLHLVDVIPAEELKGKTTVEIADRVYDMMLNDLRPDFEAAE